VSDRFDQISPPVLRALKQIADKGREHGKPVTLCGELASKPIGALVLAAIGYRSMSLSASAIGPVKAAVLDIDVAKVEALVLPLLGRADGTIRDKLEAFAAAEGVQL
jgi:phosphotransferase system enzyme I (PtsP)